MERLNIEYLQVEIKMQVSIEVDVDLDSPVTSSVTVRKSGMASWAESRAV